MLQDGTICRVARPACENVFQYRSIYCHYLKWYVNDFYEYLDVFDTHILIKVLFFFLFLLVLNNINIFTWYNSNVNILRNSFGTDLKYVLLEGTFFHPRCDKYPLNIHYCYSLTEAESVTKDCASRPNHLQSSQASLRKCVWILVCVCVGTFHHKKICNISLLIQKSTSINILCLCCDDWPVQKKKFWGTELTWRCSEWNWL